MKSPLESRAEVDALDTLHGRRRTLLADLAPLRAMHGAFGMFDPKRKALVESMKVRARLRLTETGGKVTDAIIDAEAHCDPQYQRWLDEQLTEKVQYIQLEAQYDELVELIRNREISLQVFNAEIRFQR